MAINGISSFSSKIVHFEYETQLLSVIETEDLKAKRQITLM